MSKGPAQDAALTGAKCDDYIAQAIARHRELHKETPPLVIVSGQVCMRMDHERLARQGVVAMWHMPLDLRRDEDGQPIHTIMTIASGQSAGAMML